MGKSDGFIAHTFTLFLYTFGHGFARDRALSIHFTGNAFGYLLDNNFFSGQRYDPAFY